MDTPQISRSGRVLKKSAKVKEMEDFDINELDMQGRPRKKSLDDDDKRVAPIKIPKLSLSLGGQQKRMPNKGSPIKKQFVMDESSGDGSKGSDSSSVTSESSSTSSSSEDSDSEEMRQRFSNVEVKQPQEKVIVEPYRQFDSPVAFVDHASADMSMEGSDDEDVSDSALVIAEESNDSLGGARGGRRGMQKKRPAPRKGVVAKKRTPPAKAAIAKKEKPASGKSKPLSAYMLWCSENRKRIAASSGNLGFGNIGKKLGEAWQALSDKEKMAWRRKAKRLSLKTPGGLISTGPVATAVPKQIMVTTSRTPVVATAIEEPPRALGTAAVDSAAYLKLLGDSLSVIGQRLTEHEGQLAVSGIFSVLLDTILCVVGPLLCLTSESPVLNSLPQDTSRRTLDSIAYFMPGL